MSLAYFAFVYLMQQFQPPYQEQVPVDKCQKDKLRQDPHLPEMFDKNKNKIGVSQTGGLKPVRSSVDDNLLIEPLGE